MMPSGFPELSSEQVAAGVGAVVVLVVGWVLARIARALLGRALRSRSPQTAMVAQIVVQYTVVGLSMLLALQQLGVDATVLVGAAGVLTVALGFASQTSASNIISGLFLLGERPFVVGDVVDVEGTVGEVIRIDLMSVKLRTFSNLLVRLPNEAILKSRITNLTHFPIRRFDMTFAVPHHVPFASVRDCLQGVADALPQCLDEPRPRIWFGAMTLDGIEVQFSVWTETSGYYLVSIDVPAAVQEALRAKGIPLAVRTWARQGD